MIEGLMQDATWQAFSERVSFDDSLHVGCEATGLPLGDLQQAALRERNLSVLSTLSAFSERRAEPADNDQPLAQEIARLDGKLNVLMAMFDQWLRRDAALPPRMSLRFNALGAWLPAGLWPVSMTTGMLRLHFDGCLALPLELPARLVQECDGNHVFVAFEGLDELSCDAIERLVFRHHRRKVAERRQGMI
jgi:hypothetical protein